MFKLAPSLLAADFWNLETAVRPVLNAGVEVLHIDVMDGHFVPNLTMGPFIVRALKSHCDATLDVHLMVTDPDRHWQAFAEAGAHWISFHIEAQVHHHRVCQAIQEAGCKAGIAINPGTPLNSLEAMLEHVDFVLLMSVNPGFGGQKFIPTSIDRLKTLREMIHQTSKKPFVQMDGGIGSKNIETLVEAGMNVAVAGSSVFSAQDPALAAKDLIAKAEAIDVG